MADSWTVISLGACGDWYSGGTPDTGTAKYWNGDIPWISASSLHDFYIRDSERRVTQLGLENGTRLMPAQTILFVVRGMSLKTEFRVGVAQRPVAFGQDCKAIIVRDGIDPTFLANYLRARAPEILGLADEASHGTGRLQTEALKQLEVDLPPLPEQRAIAAVLGSLDDKIELNRRMNVTLEGLARALFQAWFVEFEPVRAKMAGRPTGLAAEIEALFPEALEAGEDGGERPRGWEVVPLRSICEYIMSGGTPSTQEQDFWGGDIPWLSSGETRQRFIIETEKTITRLGVQRSSTRLARAYSTVIAGAGQGHTRGQTSLLLFDSYVNQSVVALAANRLVCSDLFLFFSLVPRYDEFRQLSDSHSSRGSLTTKLLSAIPLTCPPVELIRQADLMLGPIVERIRANLYEMKTLAALRDGLLPGLMRGEVRVAVE